MFHSGHWRQQQLLFCLDRCGQRSGTLRRPQSRRLRPSASFTVAATGLLLPCKECFEASSHPESSRLPPRHPDLTLPPPPSPLPSPFFSRATAVCGARPTANAKQWTEEAGSMAVAGLASEDLHAYVSLTVNIES